jgi:hypothetical protein
MATKKITPRKVETKDTPCKACASGGEVAVTVRVGRKRREVGQQLGWCLRCEGTGIDPGQ